MHHMLRRGALIGLLSSAAYAAFLEGPRLTRSPLPVRGLLAARAWRAPLVRDVSDPGRMAIWSVVLGQERTYEWESPGVALQAIGLETVFLKNLFFRK